ncbi:uncharacterized protein LOC126743255 [Anthonomus grandis grandis]|uniref:uncharacterized protein LOC126743255 n=1 Tax=Anthonomus grandis grandis TaxID=2921223 RepID=UPI002165C5AF|nr:uncharacterized protein LOC126743255 [Anthonomus grandis grandis]
MDLENVERALVAMIEVATSTTVILCDQIVTQSKKTMTVCYSLQDYISIFSTPYQELQLFTNRIPIRKVDFNALGLFQSKRSLILSIMGGVATNFIVAEQFWKP